MFKPIGGAIGLDEGQGADFGFAKEVGGDEWSGGFADSAEIDFEEPLFILFAYLPRRIEVGEKKRRFLVTRWFSFLDKYVACHGVGAGGLVVGIESGGREKEVVIEPTVAAFDILQTGDLRAVRFEPWGFAAEFGADDEFSSEDVVGVGTTLGPVRKGNG